MKRLANKVALVTGGAQGIGKAIARKFLDEGAKVVAADIDGGLLEKTVAELSARGPVQAVPGDISRRPDVRRMVQACLDSHGRLDVLAANAGITDFQPLLEIEDARWRRVLEVNLQGTFYCIQEAGRAMARQGGGAIVVTASTNAFWMESNLAAYNTSKGAIIALMRSAAIDLAEFHIRANAVEPGVVRTRLAKAVEDNPQEAANYLRYIPMNRFCEAEEVASAVAFLASEEASYITGQALVLDGGTTSGMRLAMPQGPLPGTAASEGAS
jgi:NAD(P)-dependent dehydrogenase (short-subunit alcohol dehydrogenase family)